MKFIYCSMADNTYLINVDSICGILVKANIRGNHIVVNTEIHTNKNNYDLVNEIIYDSEAHNKSYVLLQFPIDVAQGLYCDLETYDYINMDDVISAAELEMRKNILQHGKSAKSIYKNQRDF